MGLNILSEMVYVCVWPLDFLTLTKSYTLWIITSPYFYSKCEIKWRVNCDSVQYSNDNFQNIKDQTGSIFFWFHWIQQNGILI